MKKILTISLLLCCLACKRQQPFDDTAFDSFKGRFILAYWEQNPTNATSAGFHNYDSLLPAYTETYRKQADAFCEIYLDSLELFKVEKLNPSNRLDRVMLQNALHSQLFYADTFKAWQWDASNYNVGSNIDIRSEL